MSSTLESEPTMLDCPAKMKTRIGSAARLRQGCDISRLKTVTTKRKRVVGFVYLFMFDDPVQEFGKENNHDK